MISAHLSPTDTTPHIKNFSRCCLADGEISSCLQTKTHFQIEAHGHLHVEACLHARRQAYPQLHSSTYRKFGSTSCFGMLTGKRSIHVFKTPLPPDCHPHNVQTLDPARHNTHYRHSHVLLTMSTHVMLTLPTQWWSPTYTVNSSSSCFAWGVFLKFPSCRCAGTWELKFFKWGRSVQWRAFGGKVRVRSCL